MHSFIERTTAFCGFFSTCFMWYLAVMFLLDLSMRPKEPRTSFNVGEISFSIGREDGFVSRKDKILNINFDADFDFNKTATWNTKNIFVYLLVEYVTERMTKNEFVIWDKILGGDSWRISEENIKQKYYKNDIVKNGFGQEQATIKLCWSITPYVGWIKKREHVLQTIQLPIK